VHRSHVTGGCDKIVTWYKLAWDKSRGDEFIYRHPLAKRWWM